MKSKKGRSSYHTGTTPVSHYDPNQFDSSKWLITIYHIQRNYLPGQTEFIYGCNNGASIKWTHWWLGGDSSGMTHPPINKKKGWRNRRSLWIIHTACIYSLKFRVNYVDIFLFSSHEIHGQNNDRLLFVISSRSRDVEHTHPRNFSYSQCRG